MAAAAAAAAHLPIYIFYYKIQAWLQEFYRRDMMDRYEAANACPVQTQRMKHLTDDIRANTPVYIINILTTYSNTQLQMPFTLPNCDPNLIEMHNRIPPSHITSFYRRSISRFLLTDS